MRRLIGNICMLIVVAIMLILNIGLRGAVYCPEPNDMAILTIILLCIQMGVLGIQIGVGIAPRES